MSGYYPERTAISRSQLPLPLRDGKVLSDFPCRSKVLNYGCGKDVYTKQTIPNVTNYDAFCKDNTDILTRDELLTKYKAKFDVAIACYVLNVLRTAVKQGGLLYFIQRADLSGIKGRQVFPGHFVTKRRTIQVAQTPQQWYMELCLAFHSNTIDCLNSNSSYNIFKVEL